MVKLIRDDRVAEPLRAGVRRRYGGIDESKVAYLLQCPWCLSFWFGSALTLGRRRWPGATEMAARALAVSALTGLLSEQLDRPPRA
ncbi:hypothetical protein ABIE44_001534 [Marmoricola sp. OAE513]|uniref:DUF1360 domain-containing protein n=1 Tax=Marmoricola sp. OAE513 TaxID=2817894 RepID=UPI001AEB2373